MQLHDLATKENTAPAVVPRGRPPGTMKHALRYAVGRPRNVAIISAVTSATVVLLSVGLPAVGLMLMTIGLIFYTVTTVADAAEMQAGIHGVGVRRSELLELSAQDICTPELRGRYESIVERLEQIRRLVDAEPTFADALEDTYAHCCELVSEAGEIARGANSLHVYLIGRDVSSIDSRIRELQDRARHADDAVACRVYLQAVESAERHKRLHLEIAGRQDRSRARLAAIDTALRALQARLVRLSATTRELDDWPDGRDHELSALGEEVALIEQTLQESC